MLAFWPYCDYTTSVDQSKAQKVARMNKCLNNIFAIRSFFCPTFSKKNDNFSFHVALKWIFSIWHWLIVNIGTIYANTPEFLCPTVHLEYFEYISIQIRQYSFITSYSENSEYFEYVYANTPVFLYDVCLPWIEGHLLETILC